MSAVTQSSALKAEQEDNFRLKKADEFLTHCRESENQARRSLVDAIDRTKLAKLKYETLFAECEQRACQRRNSGQIVNSSQY